METDKEKENAASAPALPFPLKKHTVADCQRAGGAGRVKRTMTTAYIFLGPPESGRREILADLLRNRPPGHSGSHDDKHDDESATPAASAAPVSTSSPSPAANRTAAAASARLYLSASEFDADARATLAEACGAPVLAWDVSAGNLSIEEPETAPETVFIVTDGRASPIDQMEILAALLKRLGWEVARVLTVVPCAFAAERPALADWFKACAHFSDVILLSRRDGVPNAWVRDFTEALKADGSPSLIELVRKNGLENPARVLYPEARRRSLIFDDTDPLDDMVFDEDNLPDEPFDLVCKPDPYFERLPSGARARALPDIREFLP